MGGCELDQLEARLERADEEVLEGVALADGFDGRKHNLIVLIIIVIL